MKIYEHYNMRQEKNKGKVFEKSRILSRKGRRLYELKYNLRKKLAFRKFYVRKCTEKSYSIFGESVLY